MGEAILVVRQVPIKTPDPTIEVVDETFTSLTIRLTNNHDKDVTIFYEEGNNEPSANNVIVAATTDEVTSFSEVTLPGLNSNQLYNIYAYAIEDGQRASNVVAGQGTTLKYTTEPPIISNVVADTNSVTFDLTNDDDSTATVYYEVNDSTPDSNSVSIAGKTTVERTLGSLTEDTDYTLYARAQASNENMSSTVSEPFSTQADAISATGGSISDYNIGGTNYRVHAFTNTGSNTFNVTGSPSGATVDALIVAGGGGGGSRHGGGGGAGGLIYAQNISVSSQNYTIMVGGGGSGAPSSSSYAPTSSMRGENSSALGFTAIGGGAGSNYSTSTDSDQNGGSGGGSRGNTGNAGGQGTAGQGNNGGSGGGSGVSPLMGGGGGGADSAGTEGGDNSGNGGDGLYYGDKFTDNYGENGYFAGGGGGSTLAVSTGGSGQGSFEPGIHLFRAISNGSSVEYFTLSSTFGTSESKVGNYSDAGETVTVTFDHTGTKFYSIRRGDNKIKQYTVSTPYDIVNGTLTFEGDYTFDSSVTRRFIGLTFDGTGTKLFTSEGEDNNSDRNKLREHSLSTPWDITSASFVREVSLPGITTEGMGAVAFNQDGTRMYIGTRQNNNRDAIYQYNLSSAYNIGSVSSYQTADLGIDDPTFVQLSEDGNFMFVLHHSPNQLDRYNLSTPFDITTFSNRTTIFNDFNNDGLFISGQPQYINSGEPENTERTVALGGIGGGGNGGLGADIGQPGQTNTGGGGGGGGHNGSNYPGKSGGSGIVLIRYEI